MPIRRATAADAEVLCDLVLNLADYEKLRHEAVTTPEALRRALDPEPGEPRLEALLAETSGEDEEPEAVGMALFYPVFSSFRARWSLYLEDLFVRPAHRGRGHGAALLQALAQEAVRRNADRLDWVVLDWNETARGFYRRIGAEEKDDWVLTRLSGEALRAFAENGVSSNSEKGGLGDDGSRDRRAV